MKISGGLCVTVRHHTDESKLNSIAAEFLTSSCLLAGFSLVLCTWFESVNVKWWLLLLGMLALYSVLRVIEFFKAGKWVSPAILVLIALMCVVFYRQVLSGTVPLVNDILNSMTRIDGKIHLDIVAWQQASTLWALVPIAIILVILAQWTIRSGKMAFIIPIILLCYISVLVGLFKVNLGVVLLGFGTIMLFVRSVAAKAKLNAFCGVPSWIAVVALGTLVAIVGGYLIGPALSRTPEWDRALHSVLYDSKSNSMPEGDLKNLSSWNKNDTPALQITMTAPQKMYLRGQVYETYTASAWKMLSTEDKAEYEDLFYWLHQSDFYGQSQIAAATLASGAAQPEEMTVKYLSACDGHGYYPYAVLSENNVLSVDKIGDTFFENTSSIRYYAGSVPQWYGLQQNLVGAQSASNVAEYLALEEAYEMFITAVDLQLTDESYSVLKRQLKDIEAPTALSQIRTFIREFLAEKLVYDERVETLNGNDDFLQYTLERSGSGYSVHYATAATLMLRYFGVPARYVEGYFLSTDEAARYAAGQEIVLTEKHAHAWAEYYLPGVGFVPFEVTPGYIDDEEMELGGTLDSEEPKYSQDHLQYAEVEQPELIEDKLQNRISFSTKISYLFYLILFAILLLVLIVLIKRWRLKRVFAQIKALDNKSAITLRYAYAIRLLQTVKEVSIDGAAFADQLNREALFSNHSMSDADREQMERYAERVLVACKNKWNFWQKIRFYCFECLY